MILLVDAGNTRAKFGWLDPASGEREAQTHALDYAHIDTLSGWLAELEGRPTRVLGVSVTGSTASRMIETVCIHQCGLRVEWMDATHSLGGLHNHYEQASQLGPDRWAAVLGLLWRVHTSAAWQSGVPMLLANFGTACTIDTIANLPAAQGKRQAHFVGGLILPGPLLMARSLADGTAHLPYVQGESADYPTNTHDAISSGITAAQAGALLRQWRTALDHFKTAPQVFVSGGGWPLVQDETQRALARAQTDLGLPEAPPQYLAGPVLDGLAWLAG
ncbi:MAG: type III pantothenate kinase [Alcaligenaceae bacterium]|nr:type III pantothenate kinase [Alcaligenaceae bacterium]